MAYEKTPIKHNNRQILLEAASKLSTGTLIWHFVIKRHKVGLLATGNIVLVLNWAVPMWPQFVLSLF